MKLIFRLLIVVAILGGIAVLAKGGVAWAGGATQILNQSATASLSGLVWNDKNQNGLQEKGENGLPNVTVDLYDSSKAAVGTLLTDKTGRYRFEGLAPGDYHVHFILPAGYVASPRDQGKDEALDSDADILTIETTAATLAAGENKLLWDLGLYRAATAARPDPGTVKPPPGDVTVCENGISSVGGVATLEVRNLAEGYCLVASLRNHAFAVGRIPDGAGEVLADITFLRIFHHGKLVSDLPVSAGQSQVCYAVPPGTTTAQLYFLDFYGPRFGRPGQRNWVPLDTTVTDGIACAAAQTSGAYALIGK